MIKSYLLLLFVLCFCSANAQNIAINETGAAPDPSAMLDITSPDKGILIPRLPDHTAIAAPVQGLLVYDTTDDGFWYFDGTIWIPLLGGNLGWRIVGNEFTDATINFLGTIDEQPLMIRVNNTPAGRIDWDSAFPFDELGIQAVTAVGKNSLSSLTSGENNTAFGYESGSSLTSGAANTIVGVEAGFNATTAENNVLMGYQSGYSVSSGIMNTFVGAESGRQVTTGTRNTYLGYFAGRANGSGNENVAIGWDANSENISNLGSNNVFVGSRAGKRNSAVSANVILGARAGEFNSDGRNNTFVGFSSGRGDNTFSPGRENAFLGSQTGESCNECRWNVFLGAQAGQNISSGIANIFIGYTAGFNNTSGLNNVFLGHRAGHSISSGFNNVFLGHRAGEFLPATTSNRLMIANDLNQGDVLISGDFSTNRVGINTVVPNATFSVNGDASKTTGPDWAVFSDERVKRNIKEFSDGLDVVMKLRPVSFQYKANSGNSDTDSEFIGFVAQDVEKIAPYMVNLYDDSEGPSGLPDKRVLNTSALNQILVNALQEQQQKIEDLEARLERIEKLLIEKNENATAEKQ